MNALKEIQAVLPSLTKTQAKVATYILENPDSVCFLSLKKLAEGSRRDRDDRSQLL